MKYIKKLNINFNDWNEYNDNKLPIITIDLLCYLKIMTGHSRMTKFITNDNILRKLHENNINLIYKLFEYYCYHIEKINDNDKELIYLIFNEINIKNKNKYKFAIHNKYELIDNIILCKYCKCDEKVIIKYYIDYYETY